MTTPPRAPSLNGPNPLHPAVREELAGWALDLRREGRDTDAILEQIRLDYQAGASRRAAAMGSDLIHPTDDDFRQIAQTSRLTRFLTAEEVENLPQPVFQVGELWTVGGLVVPFGPPGVGKTFLTLDAALSMGTGMRYHGQESKRAPSVYVAAEGSGGMGGRVRAWKEHRGWYGAAGVHFLTQPVNLLSPADVETFLGELLSLDERPGAVVFDTLARCMIGGDENSALDMGRAIDAADRIRHTTGATVILVHHTNKGGDLERGSTALRGAADTMLSIKDEDGTIIVRCEKQKDAEPFKPLHLRLLRVGTSCVTERATEEWHLRTQELTPAQRQVLDEWHQMAPSTGLTASKAEELTTLPRRTFYRARKALCDAGYLESDREGRGARYRITDKGLEAVGAKVPVGATEGANAPEIGACHSGGSIGDPPMAPSGLALSEEGDR
jgi:DNA-binding transcriptional ArsR family regulator